jgi:TonB family protein
MPGVEIILKPLSHTELVFPNILASSGGGLRGGGNESDPVKPIRTAVQPLTRPPEPLPQPVPVDQLVPPPDFTPAAVVSAVPSDHISALLGPNAPIPDADLGSGTKGAGGPGPSGNGPGTNGPPGQNGGLNGGPGGTGPGGMGVDVQVVALVTPKPAYTPKAMERHIEGEVALSCLVLATGRVGSCRITKSLDPNFGLDEEALKAAANFVFKPAQRKGQAVPVTVNIVLEFHMR